MLIAIYIYIYIYFFYTHTHTHTHTYTHLYMASPMCSVVKNPPEMQEFQEPRVQSLGWEDLWEKGIAAHSRILGESHGQRSLVGDSTTGSQRVGHD